MGLFNKLRGKKEPEYNDDEIYGGADKDYYQGDEAYDESADPVLNTESSGFQTPVAKPVSNKVEVKLAKPTSHMDGPAIEAAPYGEKLSAAGLDFTVLPTPGHSRGSVCLYLEDEFGITIELEEGLATVQDLVNLIERIKG